MRLFVIFLVWIVSCNLVVVAQDGNHTDSCTYVNNSIWDNWYGQIGLDMNLLFPSGHNAKDVFPNGKSFGVNVAVGKWFSPEFGGRFKVVWNNGILPNDNNTWLAPYGEPGENHRKGGFLNFIWDIQFDMHNLLGYYKPERKWNLILSPRAGGWWDIGSGKGCPLLGVGVINTYRLNERLSLFVDAGYHFVASVNGVYSGEESGGNSFAEISLGVQYDFNRKSHKREWKTVNQHDSNKDGVELNTFWDNWFVQTGLGMSLVKPYGTGFADVFPNGKTFGVNIGLGKWFTPEAGIRGGVNWQNGIIVNKHANYLDSKDGLKKNYKEHGFLAIYADLFLNLHNILGEYDKNRRWNTIVYPRMGLAMNFSSSNKESSMLGIGMEQTYRINERLKLFGDLAYHVTTTGFLDGKIEHHSGLSHNGWLDVNLGVQYELGKNWWDKPGEERSPAVSDTWHNWSRFIVNTGGSIVVAYGVKSILKKVIKEERPDHSDDQSFPSGHAAIAFAAARSIDKEFGKDCIWIPIAGYAAAAAVGIERVASDRHHWYDVVAGAALGFGSAELTWWLSDIIFKKHNERYAVGFSGNSVDVAVNF